MLLMAPVTVYKCSTPFGIGDRCGQDGGTGETISGVLNAFRHRRSVRPPGADHQASTTTVLNAFRHRRSVRVRFNSITFPSWGAQHLSASEIGAAAKHSAALAPNLCSTPFGIGDRCGGRLRNAM
ncbi:uncharacterized protein Dmul_04210 [Desulfococcus multivorans]|nr:uncharacterized protein Dmul_04210 [Desulfococcus multivorans]